MTTRKKYRLKGWIFKDTTVKWTYSSTRTNPVPIITGHWIWSVSKNTTNISTVCQYYWAEPYNKKSREQYDTLFTAPIACNLRYIENSSTFSPCPEQLYPGNSETICISYKYHGRPFPVSWAACFSESCHSRLDDRHPHYVKAYIISVMQTNILCKVTVYKYIHINIITYNSCYFLYIIIA